MPALAEVFTTIFLVAVVEAEVKQGAEVAVGAEGASSLLHSPAPL